MKNRLGTNTGVGWAWEIKDPDGNWVLCNWAEPFKCMLYQDEQSMPGLPGDKDQRPVRVELVPTSKRNRKRYRVEDRK